MALDRKVAIVNLTTGKIDIKPISLQMRKKFLGGRGLAAYLLYKYAKPGCDPLGPDNAVIFSAGILGGMPRFRSLQNRRYDEKPPHRPSGKR